MKKYGSLALALLLTLAGCSPADDAPSTKPGSSTLSQSVEATTPVETTKAETTPAETGPVKIEHGKFTIFCMNYNSYYVVDPWCPITMENRTFNDGDWFMPHDGTFYEIEADATGFSEDSWNVDQLFSAKEIILKDAVDTFGIPELGAGSDSALQVYRSGSEEYILARDTRGYKVFFYDAMRWPQCVGIIPFNYAQDGILTAEAVERFLHPQKNEGPEVAILAKQLTEGLKDASASSDDISDVFVAAYTEFADKLADVMLDQSEKGSNFLISPLSVMTCISMAANGAAGDTLTQMEAALGENLNLEEVNKGLQSWYVYFSKNAPEALRFANSIWLNKDSDIEERIREDFLRKSINNLDTSIYSTPFNTQGLEDINNWSRSKTFGMIPNILDRFNDGDAIVLLNTLLFDAQWTIPFDPAATVIQDFKDSNGNIEKVEMMCGYAECELWDSDTVQDPFGVVKSFEGTPFVFAALLPRRDESAEDLLRRLDAQKLGEMFEMWKKYGSPGEESMELFMPKFDYSADYDLSGSLKALGITDAFDQAHADFSNMTGDRSLFLTRAVHKTSIELNERGTRIAAGAAMSGGYGMSLSFDRPFVYVIYESNYGLPVFIGLVNHIN
jgi:serpin B